MLVRLNEQINCVGNLAVFIEGGTNVTSIAERDIRESIIKESAKPGLNALA